jgi:membrane protein implicated in regulation of membrane protease activity
MLDLGIDLNAWPWVWLAVGVFFAIIELTVLAGSFVLLPFAVSAFAASLLAFYDVAIEIQWFVFIFGGGVLWYFAYKWARKFADDNAMEPGVGAERLVGLVGIVTTAIEPNDSDRRGRVTVNSEVWGALTEQHRPLPEGSRVRITSVQGTRVFVEPAAPGTSSANSVDPSSPASGPPSQ